MFLACAGAPQLLAIRHRPLQLHGSRISEAQPNQRLWMQSTVLGRVEYWALGLDLTHLASSLGRVMLGMLVVLV